MAHAAAAEARKGTQRFYDALWTKQSSGSAQRAMAIAASLDALAQIHDRKITPTMAEGYHASLADLTREELVLAFSRAQNELKFFPLPATLREYSGRPATGDPVAAEAKQELFRIVTAMRVPQPQGHGPKLRDILGRVLYGTEEKPLDEHGKPCGIPRRAPGPPFPLSRRTEAALVRLGWGCRETGIALIAEHPIVSGGTAEDGEFQINRLRASDELLAKWTAVYREVR